MSEEIINILLGTANDGNTAQHCATERGNSEILQKIWECSKDKLTTEEVNNKFLLVTGNKERSPWHVATQCGKLEILQKALR